MIQKKNLVVPLAALALVVSGATATMAVAHADTTSGSTSTSTTKPARQKPAAMGTVTAVSGNTITLTDKMNNTTYSVDASNAAITKHEKPATQGAKPTDATITVADVAVGDTLMVQGTVSGTTVTATKIDDGMGFGMRGGGNPGMNGTVTAVNGVSITITGKDGKTYTVDASSATAQKLETISTSDIQVGDEIGVKGSISGTTITAKNIMDGMMKGPAKGGQ